ncbi:GNAT family N-acetyltransferase [Polynucleobacter arcticus]|uniref:GNAT family N-acetyltransferase n=1 Tax=Polynucleobacter arcticus TaxID=1743165 RepID=A0A6M9PH26_9BURK|nr:GNAT family N-acetyltransferase [Polynucleobacter arcticus]QKM61404.1 GNAT family N-acetyltransferase [Polynucleobacter arcticus]
MITYTEHASISPEQAIDLYTRSTLGERRPIDNIKTFEAMLANANLTISAWDGEKLVGISRNLTDFAYVAYLADLAVDEQYQRQGIGKRLIEETQARLGPSCMIVLLAAPKANAYYEHLGFEHNPRAWMMKNNLI